MSLPESFERLQSALMPLGIELGYEVLAIWRDRERAGREPIPEAALRDLIVWAEKHLSERS